MTDWSKGTCPKADECAFYMSVSRSPVLRIKYATMYPYCKGSRHESCMRYWLIEQRKPVPDDLLPDGGKDLFIPRGDAHAPLKPGRVMVVDDMPVFRVALVGLVNNTGLGPFKIEEADSAERALARLTEDPSDWDAVVTDFNMGIMNGYELILQMRLNPALAALPAIVFSSEKDEGTRERCLALPRVRWLDKKPDQVAFNAAWRELVVEKKA